MSFAMPVAEIAQPNAATPFFGVDGDAVGAVGDSQRDAHPAPEPTADPGWAVASDGRAKEHVMADGDRHCAVATHLSPLAFVWIGPFALAIPLILWLVRKDQSRFMDDHGRESVNFIISFIVLHILLPITIIGIALLPVLWVVGIVNMIRAAMAANRHEYFRYPVTIRFL